MEKFLVLESLSDLGSWVTIIGFIMTCITAYLVFSIKDKFLFRANVESNCSALQQKAEELSALLGDYTKNVNQIDEHLATTDVILRALEQGASDNFLKDIKKCRKSIQKYSMKKFLFFLENTNKNETLVREIKTSLTVIVEESKYVRQALVVGK